MRVVPLTKEVRFINGRLTSLRCWNRCKRFNPATEPTGDLLAGAPLACRHIDLSLPPVK